MRRTITVKANVKREAFYRQAIILTTTAMFSRRPCD